MVRHGGGHGHGQRRIGGHGGLGGGGHRGGHGRRRRCRHGHRHRRAGTPQVRRCGVFVELDVALEHAQQVLFQPHHQRVHPGVEQHVRTFQAHLRRIAGGEVLHVHGRRDHRAGDAQALGDVALHLRAQHQLGLGVGDGRLDLEVVVADQRFEAVELGGVAHRAREFAAVGAQAHDGEAQLGGGHAGSGHGMAGVAEHEDPLVGQVGRIDRAGIPGGAGTEVFQFGQQGRGVDTGQRGHFGDEVARGAHADRHHLGVRLAVVAAQPGGGGVGDLGVEHDVEIGLAQPGQVGHAGTLRRADMDVDAQAGQQAGDLDHVVAVAEAQRGGAQQVAAHALPGLARRARCGRRRAQVPYQLVESFGGAPVFLALVAGQFERDDRHRQVQRLGQAARVVLDQLGGAGRTHQHRRRLEALERIERGGLEQLGGVATQVARLEGGVGDRRALVAALDHREQQVGVGVALRRVQHVVHVLHRGGDAHRADVRRAFVSPERQLHGFDLRPPAAAPPRRVPACGGAATDGRTTRPGHRPARSPGSG